MVIGSLHIPNADGLHSVRARISSWVLAVVLLLGSLAAYHVRLTLLAAVIGSVIVASVEPRPAAGRVATVAAALLLSSLPWAMTLAIRSDQLDLAVLTLGLVPSALGLLLLLRPAAGVTRSAIVAVPSFVIMAIAVIWLAFGTSYGHFWLNVRRLDALAATLASTPAIISLSLGDRDRDERGNGFDDYRFVNGVLVTHYLGQARPDRPQPTIFIDDELRVLGVPRERYDALRRLMAQADIGVVVRDPGNGHVTMIRVGFDNEWNSFLIYAPGARSPGRNLAPLGSPKRGWFWVTRS